MQILLSRNPPGTLGFNRIVPRASLLREPPDEHPTLVNVPHEIQPDRTALFYRHPVALWFPPGAGRFRAEGPGIALCSARRWPIVERHRREGDPLVDGANLGRLRRGIPGSLGKSTDGHTDPHCAR